MTTLTELLASHPLAVEAIDLQSVHNRYTVATKVRDYANLNGVGDFAFDSIETLLDLIESKLKAERGLSDKEIEDMKWSFCGCRVEHAGMPCGHFSCFNETGRKVAIAAQHAIVDALHAEIKRLRKEPTDAR